MHSLVSNIIFDNEIGYNVIDKQTDNIIMNGADISIDEEIKIFKTIKPVDIKNIFNLYFNNMCVVITGKHDYKLLKNDIDKIMI